MMGGRLPGLQGAAQCRQKRQAVAGAQEADAEAKEGEAGLGGGSRCFRSGKEAAAWQANMKLLHSSLSVEVGITEVEVSELHELCGELAAYFMEEASDEFQTRLMEILFQFLQAVQVSQYGPVFLNKFYGWK